MNQLPKDPFILLSYVNTRLRDRYASLEALCDDLDIRPDQVTTPLASVGYVYDKELNKFV